MITFTKEQLISRINQVTAINKYRISRDPAADGLAMDNELFAIALASLEADPVAWRYRHHNGLAPSNWKVVDSEDECNVAPNYQRQALYTAPPAPVSVPNEVLARLEHEANHLTAWHHIDEHSCKVCRRDLLTLVNACRAAMLQGGKS